MFELALHILDLVQNSITAGARLIEILIDIDTSSNLMTITIRDDGCGMDEALVARVLSPFGTTRTTRKVGLGIPMFMQIANMCGGEFSLNSTPGEGTVISASFQIDHIDRPPLGDIGGTMRALLIGAPETLEFLLALTGAEEPFAFDTREIREVLSGVPLDSPDVQAWMSEYLEEGLAPYKAIVN